VDPNPTLIELDLDWSSVSVLGTIVALGLLTYLLYYIGALGSLVNALGQLVRWSIRAGFHAWENCFSWANWLVHLGLAVGLVTVGVLVVETAPAITILISLAVLFLGLTSCLAYMHVDIERYEVERGYKAVHNPLKGQSLAPDLARYGEQADVLLLLASTVAVIGGFALVNHGLYHSAGHSWYRVHESGVGYTDFLTYALLNLLRVVDILDLASSRQLLHMSFVRPVMWPASVLIVLFRTFFTLVLLQQIFASIRQGRVLAETIADFWSPHEAIQQRARNALPQYGAAAIGPLLVSLRSVTGLTKEQRDQLPQILAAIGPSTVPTLVRHLNDSHEHVRGIAAAALGHLNAQHTLPTLSGMVRDPSDHVRQSLAEGLGMMAEAETRVERAAKAREPRRRRLWFRRAESRTPSIDHAAVMVAALRELLVDENAAVRCQAANGLGRAGDAAEAAVPDLVLRLGDADETVECEAAEALGRIGGATKSADAARRALVDALADPSAAVRVAAARGLGAMGPAARPAVEQLMPLLQDRDEAVRDAAAAAISAAGPLDETAAATLAQGLDSPDNVIRAQTAEVLGEIGEPTEKTAEALADSLRDSNDVVRAKAAEALGKLGEGAAEVAVPRLVKALRDRDSWVSALAAEALGEMGEAADSAVPALVRAVSHVNVEVRARAAAALGKLGSGAEQARPALEKAAADAEGGVRAEAIRALGQLGRVSPVTLRLIRNGLSDPDPLVRAAGVDALNLAERPAGEVESSLLPLLDDANDEVKLRVIRVLANRVGATKPVIEGLCHRLLEDDSTWMQEQAGLGLTRLGRAAVSAGPALLRAAQTGEAGVREQAMKALAVIQPPEAAQAFTVGLKDPDPSVRMIASAGWMKANEIPADAVGALVEALRDPEIPVRANAAHALSRIEQLPPAAIPTLIEATSDPSDNLRLNAALALRNAPLTATAKVMEGLLEDGNPRVRLLAAGALLSADRANDRARAVAEACRDDPSPRVRRAAEEVLKSAPPPSATPADRDSSTVDSSEPAGLRTTA
jgi:HEAT repeat protein